jgi:hypothetical protein
MLGKIPVDDHRELFKIPVDDHRELFRTRLADLIT